MSILCVCTYRLDAVPATRMRVQKGYNAARPRFFWPTNDRPKGRHEEKLFGVVSTHRIKKHNKGVEKIKRIINLLRNTHTHTPRMFTGCAWAAPTLASMAVLKMFIEVLRTLHT